MLRGAHHMLAIAGLHRRQHRRPRPGRKYQRHRQQQTAGDGEQALGGATVHSAEYSHRLWPLAGMARSEEHTSELQSLMRISYAVFCLKIKKYKPPNTRT